MFDNLREKLGSFRDDAEEAAEENVEAVDEEALVALDEDEGEALEDGDGDTITDAEQPQADAEQPRTNAEQPQADAELETGDDGEHTPSDADAPGEASERGDGPDEPPTDVPRPSVGDVERTGIGAGGESAAHAESASTPPESTGESEPAAVESASDPGTDADENSTGFGRKAKSLVRGKFVIEEDDLEGPLRELELALLASDVELSVAEEVLDNIRDELVGETRTFTTSTGAVVENALKEAIYDVISVGQFDFETRVAEADKPLVIVFTGVNGVGKTTSIAKLDRYFAERGYSTVMANGDTYRAGANEQIREHAETRGTKLIAHEQGGDPAAVLYDAVEYAEANDVDIVLGDTAGRLHTDEGLMDQLEKIGRVVDPDMTLFVDEAVAGQDAVNRAREFNEAIEFDGAILTKADADANGGAAISVAQVTGKPILFLGVGQGYDDIERFDPDELVDRLLAGE